MTPHDTVEEYMKKDVVSILRSASLREAVELMRETNTNSLVVVDEKKRVVGMFSTTDAIHAIIPRYLEEDRHVAAFESKKVFAERIHEVGDKPITIAMSSRVQSVKPTDTLIEAAVLLTEHRINQLPVIDDQGQLIGYIGRSNIKAAIGDVFDERPS